MLSDFANFASEVDEFTDTKIDKQDIQCSVTQKKSQDAILRKTLILKQQVLGKELNQIRLAT